MFFYRAFNEVPSREKGSPGPASALLGSALSVCRDHEQDEKQNY